MNKRTFLKTMIVGAITVPFVGLSSNGESSELRDLYSFLESKKIPNPYLGLVDFKLHPFQKDILKTIHENDNVVFVKARQIGMTTLLAGYAAWRMNSPESYVINSHSCHSMTMFNYYTDLRNNFVKQSVNRHQSTLTSDTKILLSIDELNLRPQFKTVRDVVGWWGGREIIDKMIVTGTMNPMFKSSIPKLVQDFGFKVEYYPATRCQPMWTNERIEQFKRNVPDHYMSELYCQTV